jgi:hypothetical protein
LDEIASRRHIPNWQVCLESHVRISKYATNQSLLSLYFGELAFKILKDFSVAALCFIGIIVRPFSEFFLLVVAAISMIMLSRVFLSCDKAMRLSIQVRSYDLLKVSIEQQMAELQEKISGAFDVSGTWKGNFCAGQQGVLKVTQDGNNLQAILTTDCLHLGIDEVYQEELSGTIKGRQVILAGESVSSAQEEISYELDDFELTLSIDGKKLTGTVLDKDGVNGAEFLRKD